MNALSHPRRFLRPEAIRAGHRSGHPDFAEVAHSGESSAHPWRLVAGHYFLQVHVNVLASRTVVRPASSIALAFVAPSIARNPTRRCIAMIQKSPGPTWHRQRRKDVCEHR